MTNGGGVRPGCDQALDEHDMGPLVEDRSLNTNRRQVNRSFGVAGRQALQRRGAHVGVDHGGDALAMHHQPRVELEAAAWVDPIEELAGSVDIEAARFKLADVDNGAIGQRGNDRVPGERGRRADRLSEPSEAPPQRPERVGRCRKQLRTQHPSAQGAV
ncbi:MAG: hypothetical protein V9E89_03500 [Ilumatobacteraceae bacterium]